MTKTIKYVPSSDGLKIYADSNGNFGKTALVFVHGFRLTGACFDRIFEDADFSNRFHLIRYDLRGQGRSGHPESAEGHVSKLYADDFAAVCDAFEVRKPYTVGWSYGCSILSDVATFLPSDYLSGSVLLCGPPFLGASLQGVVSPALLPILMHLGSETFTAAESEDAAWKFTNMLFSTPDDVPIETKWLWRGMMSSAPAISYRFVVMREVDTTALFALGKKGYPVHYIIGTDEQAFDGPAMVKTVQPHFTKFTVLYIEKGGHSVFHQNTQQVIESITQFVDNNRWTGCKD